MPFSTLSQAAVPNPQSGLTILESRHQYRSCHIHLPGESERIAAIVVGEQFYSLFKVVRDWPKALKTGNLLVSKGQQVVLTKTGRGAAIWTWEPDAIVDARTQTHLQSVAQPTTLPTRAALISHDRYQRCQIRVSDLDDRLEAIQVDGKYYGLFKVVETSQQALELAMKLERRGDIVVITQTPQGETIWVLEPDARPV